MRGSEFESGAVLGSPVQSQNPDCPRHGCLGGGAKRGQKNLRYPRVSRELALFLAKPELARSFYTECARCQRYDFFLGERQFLKTRWGAPVKKTDSCWRKSAPGRFASPAAPLKSLAASRAASREAVRL